RLPSVIREFKGAHGLTENVATPLLLGSRTLGWMTVCRNPPSEPERRWVRAILSEAIAQHAALALHHSRLIDLHRRVERRQGAVGEGERLGSATPDTPPPGG